LGVGNPFPRDGLVEPKPPFGQLLKRNLKGRTQSGAKVAPYLCTTKN
jgi:hypothetical protein